MTWQKIDNAPKDTDHGIITRRGYFVFWTQWCDENEVWVTVNRFYEDSPHAKRFGDAVWRPEEWMPLIQNEAEPT